MAPSGHRPHVLVARLDNVGDVLLSGPAVRAVARDARHVTYLASSAGAAAAAMLPGVDSVQTFDAPWVAYDPPPISAAAVQALIDEITARRVDRAFVLTSFHQSPLPLALLLRLAGVPEIAAACEDYAGALLDVRHRPDDDLHEVERSLSLVAQLGHRLADGDRGHLALREPLPAWRPFARPYVVVHPGASVPARGWDDGRARAVVDGLVADGWMVAVTGTRHERASTARVAGRARSEVADLGGRTDLRTLAGVVQGASAIVTGNTGPAHLAAAVQTPVVSLFAPVVPWARWRPWDVATELLGDQHISCAGCRARTCPYEGQPCTADVDAAHAVAAVRRLSRSAIAS
jgi:ADP-heptose:LPS heptosyltransferase